MTGVDDAWQGFCDELAAAGTRLRGDGYPDDPSERAEGYRHLARLAVMALQGHVEFGDPDFPAFHRYDDDAVKWGGPNVDNQYLRARIDPAGTYRVVGDVTGVRDLIVSVHEGDMQLEQYGVFAERQLAELDVDTDGTLTFHVGGPARDGRSWIPLDPAARLLLIRVYVADWNRDGVPWFDIERVDRPHTVPPRLDPAGLAHALDDASAWVTRSAAYWPEYLESSPVRGVVNRLTPPRSAAGGSDRIGYGAGWWDLGPEETLAIELPDPAADYWSVQLYSSPWFESLDVRNRVTSASSATVAPDADGTIRLAVGGTDPGIPGWLDTEGRRTGMVSYRIIGATREVVPTVRLVPTGAPWPDRVTVTSEARAAQIRARRAGIARRFHR